MIAWFYILVIFLAIASECKSEDLMCKRCGHSISTLNKVLETKQLPTPDTTMLAGEASAGNDAKANADLRFVNKLGQEFDIISTKEANVRVISQKVAKDSFFPGYTWRMVECPACSTFVGWEFARPAQCSTHGDHSHEINEKQQQDMVRETNENAAMTSEEILKAIGPRCLTKALGYWNVEWCNGKAISQFHLEKTVQNPLYSLGQYTKGEELPANIHEIKDTNLRNLIGVSTGDR